MSTVEGLIEKLKLVPHPEGGYYARTYQSEGNISQECLSGGFNGNRPFSTAIYFLLEKGKFSAFHRIKSDECWHFYTGETLLIHIINPAGELVTVKLGNKIEKGEIFQYVVPAGYWFASEPAFHTSFSFVGCTVAPGFDFEDFELAHAADLVKQYPQHKLLIERLCRQ